jgi:kynureninase
LGQGYALRTVAPEDVAGAINDEVAVVMLTEVDYRTGRMHDMKAVTEMAHASGAVMLWDLAHSAGALPVDLTAANCEFAVGCTYKYLNGGPGAPAFIYVRPDLAEVVEPALSGWLGHRAPFDFDLNYKAGRGIDRMRVGTPPVLQMAALQEAMKLWDDVDMVDIRAGSIALQEQFIEEIERDVPQLELASPRDSNLRGSQVSFRFEHGYAAMQAVIDRGVIGDFRAPDIMRFGFTPMYLDSGDVTAAVKIIHEVMDGALWDDDAYKVRNAVT